MTARRFIFGSLLLLHTAFSLLGSAGLHSALGCHHEHVVGAGCAADQASTSHQHHCGCKHARGHSHSTAANQDHQHSLPPLTDDDCEICQFFTRPAEATIAFHWTPWIAVVTEISIEVIEQPGVVLESVYDVRGPPHFAC